ncbi:flagellar protein FliT [Ornithinibacillus salinisoli]|uniref:Flagellar protein FliT n=1 Tax=Ornithinibacillus salinisoli TaxID=1848459 RepID=A0ABW4W2R1_9BACI
MNRLESVHHITLQLEDILDQDVSAKNRQSIIEKITSLLEKRGSYMDEVSPPFTSEEKVLGEKLVQLNKSIEAKMQKLFSELKVEMKQAKKQKKSNRTYVNPYDKVQTMDGMFMDHKK